MAVDLQKLKKKASDLEAKKQLEKALEAYQEILDAFEAGEAEPVDIPLYNRVGDLHQKLGNTAEAVTCWERAVDHYMDGGFHNPAIALCSKILRQSPGRTVAYYKLGRCLAEKGFRAEARQNFLEYATRMQKAGNVDESFRALKEFADLVPDQDDVRVTLADQLAKAGRVPEAIEQLQLAHAMLVRAGKGAEAEGVLAKLQELDPSADVGQVELASGGSRGGLVFLDLDGQSATEPTAAGNEPPPDEPIAPLLGLETTSLTPSTPIHAIEPLGLDSLLDLPMVDAGAPAEPTGLGDGIDLIDIPETVEPVRPSQSLLDLPLLGTESPELPALDFPLLDLPGAPPRRPTSAIALRPIDAVRAQLEADPTDWASHRAFGELLVDAGDREAGIAALETALTGFEQGGDLDAAGQVADDLVRLAPEELRYLRKRVEFAAGATVGRRVAAALDLADRLHALGEDDEARALYARVLAIAPDDLRAQAAVEALTPAAPAVPVAPAPSVPVPTTPAETPPEGGYISLADWLRDDDEPKSTRLVAEEQRSGDDEADFDEMLSAFRAGVAETVDEGDHQSHYDLGVAFKEMGLLDEAIAQFQQALRGAGDRVRTIEALGGCFVERGQLPVAATILRRAFDEPGVADETLLGVLYLLGVVAEAQGQADDARSYFERVVAVDITFRDAGQRLQALESSAAPGAVSGAEAAPAKEKAARKTPVKKAPDAQRGK